MFLHSPLLQKRYFFGPVPFSGRIYTGSDVFLAPLTGISECIPDHGRTVFSPLATFDVNSDTV